MVALAVKTNAPTVARHFTKRGIVLAEEFAMTQRTLAGTIKTIRVRAVKQTTPRGHGTPRGTPAKRLYETTEGHFRKTPRGYLVTVEQTKTVGRKQWLLAALLSQGHRIVTRSGVDTGRSTAPNPYLDRALAIAAPEEAAALRRSEAVLRRAMRGGTAP